MAETIIHPRNPSYGASPSAEPSSSVVRFHSLDGMRGVAAILVAIYHFYQRTGQSVLSGYLAVDLFFALSGFVIAYKYAGRFAEGLGVLRFLEIRMIRLYPLHAAGTLLGALKQIVGLVIGDARAMPLQALTVGLGLNLLLLPTVVETDLFPLNGPSWSLFFEVLINLAFAAYLWRASNGVILIVMAASAAVLFFGIGHPLFFNVGWGWPTFHLGMARCAYSFSVGLLICRHFVTRRQHVLRVSYLSCLPVVLMAAIILAPIASNMRSLSEFTIVVAVFPLLIMLGVKFDVPKKVAFGFSFLGDLSYAVYALHWPLLALLMPMLRRSRLPFSVSALGFVLALLLIAYLAAKADDLIRAKVSRWAKLKRAAPMQRI